MGRIYPNGKVYVTTYGSPENISKRNAANLSGGIAQQRRSWRHGSRRDSSRKRVNKTVKIYLASDEHNSFFRDMAKRGLEETTLSIDAG